MACRQHSVPQRHILTCHNLKIVDGAVGAMLREGRRFGVGLTLISQFKPDKKTCDVLEQASTSYYFLPNEQNLTSVAQMIDPNNYREWRDILDKLDRGKCVVKGKYRISGCKEVDKTGTLICRVEAINTDI